MANGPLNIMGLPPKESTNVLTPPSATATTTKAKQLATKKTKPSTGAGLTGALTNKGLV